MTQTSMVWQDQFERDYANGYDEYRRSVGPQQRQKADACGLRAWFGKHSNQEEGLMKKSIGRMKKSIGRRPRE